MAKLNYKNGVTSVILRIKIQDSASTAGAGLTGLTSSSTGLIISTIADNEATTTAYTVAGSTIETITTLGTFSAPTSTKCRFKEIDATNHKGLYEIQIADARWAVSNAKSVIISVQVTGGVPIDAEIQLEPVPSNQRQLLDTAVPTPTVAGIPNVNVKTWNDLTAVALPLVPTTAGRTLDVSAGGEAGIDWANVGSPTTTLVLSGTTISTTQKVDVETIKTNPVVNAGTVTFPTTATLASTTNITAGTITTATNVTTLSTGAIVAASFAAGAINASAIAADAITDAKVASDVTIASVTGAVGSVTGNVGGNVVGSVGSVVGLTPSNLDTTVSSRLASASYTAPTNLTAAQIATGVWTDTVGADFTTALSVGKSVMNGVTLGTGLTVASVSGAVGSVTGAVGSVTGLTAADVGAIKAKTDNLPAAPASTTNITAGTITTVTNLTNAPSAGDLTSTMKASVKTQVTDALNVDTYAELSAPPAATSSLRDKLTWLFMWARNKATQTATERKLYADDAATVVGKETVSDNGTIYTKEEVTSGP